MATRREIFQKRVQLKQSLREQHESGALRAGEPVPPVRQLSREFGLSNTVVASVLGELVEEHLFHTVPRAGTFVGPPRREGFSTFLMVLGEPGNVKAEAQQRAIKSGFEEKIAHLGGAVLCLDEETAFARSARGELPPISGVLDITGSAVRGAFWTGNESGQKAGRVRYGNDEEDAYLQHKLGYDTITFDDFRGGGDATRHLLSSGQRQIGFFGLHDPQHLESWSSWSAHREEGWRTAMKNVGIETKNLAFHLSPDADSLGAVAREVGRHLERGHTLSALVTANDEVARVLLDTLAQIGTPRRLWPSIVGFDDDGQGRDQLVSSLHLPWGELGRLAADLLWERHHGRLSSEPQRRLLAMRLVPRLTCRRDWSRLHNQPALASVS